MSVLHLDNNRIGDKGAQLLATCLFSMQLHELYVGFNEIAIVGMTALCYAVRCSRTIGVLMLSGNPLNVNGAGVVAEMLLHNSTLHTIYLDHMNDIGQSDLCVAGQQNIAVSIARNIFSNLTTLTGFELGVILFRLGYPVAPELSNDHTLRCLAQVRAAFHASHGILPATSATAPVAPPVARVNYGGDFTGIRSMEGPDQHMLANNPFHSSAVVYYDHSPIAIPVPSGVNGHVNLNVTATNNSVHGVSPVFRTSPNNGVNVYPTPNVSLKGGVAVDPLVASIMSEQSRNRAKGDEGRSHNHPVNPKEDRLGVAGANGMGSTSGDARSKMHARENDCHMNGKAASGHGHGRSNAEGETADISRSMPESVPDRIKPETASMNSNNNLGPFNEDNNNEPSMSNNISMSSQGSNSSIPVFSCLTLSSKPMSQDAVAASVKDDEEQRGNLDEVKQDNNSNTNRRNSEIMSNLAGKTDLKEECNGKEMENNRNFNKLLTSDDVCLRNEGDISAPLWVSSIQSNSKELEGGTATSASSHGIPSRIIVSFFYNDFR